MPLPENPPPFRAGGFSGVFDHSVYVNYLA